MEDHHRARSHHGQAVRWSRWSLSPPSGVDKQSDGVPYRKNREESQAHDRERKGMKGEGGRHRSRKGMNGPVGERWLQSEGGEAGVERGGGGGQGWR
jgi:hypothetical protein